jgi:phosphatidate cytidylyltransferase
MNELAQQIGITQSVLIVLASVFAALLAGTVVRLALLSKTDPKKRRKKIGSLIAWWVLAGVFAVAVLLGEYAGIVLVGLISAMGLREYLKITSERFREQPLQIIAYVALPLHYLWIALHWYETFWMFLPACVFLLVPARLILAGQTKGFITAASAVTWGLILIVYCFSHTALLLTLPNEINPAGGAVGWFLFLVILTEVNDIAQALWGRKFGRHKVIPAISPNKSWEGLILGMLTTVALAVALAPLLTPLADWSYGGKIESSWLKTLLLPGAAGLLIAIGGFFGDLNMSAVKRDLRIKDAGDLIPGQGGILDRIDSLTYTAPLFFYFVYFLFV